MPVVHVTTSLIQASVTHPDPTIKHRSCCRKHGSCILFTCLCLMSYACIAFMIQENWVWNVELKRNGYNNSSSSVFDYNYNACYYGHNQGDGTSEISIAVRCQNITGDSIYDVGPSFIMYAKFEKGIYTNITMRDVLLAPDTPGIDNAGVEDPRIVFWKKTGYYYMFYTSVAVVDDSRNHKLSLALSPSGLPNTWTKNGPLWGDNDRKSTGGAVLLDGDDILGMIWGDKSFLYWSNPVNMINWTCNTEAWLKPRKNFFDSEFVIPGPPPIKLSDGNYLFLYNSARKFNHTTAKPNYDLQYNVGYLILNGNNPRRIRYRSESPILSPDKSYETCIDGGGQTPNSVFVDGIRKNNEAKDSFTIYYSGCNSGSYEAKLTISKRNRIFSVLP
ncbi:hypothetical protein PCE1_000922 [Barthelona sp. PCE]